MFEVGVLFVQEVSVVRVVGDDGRVVGVDEVSQLGFGGVWEVVLGEVVDDFGCGGEVGLEEGEESVFVFLVVNDYGNSVVVVFCGEFVGCVWQDNVIWLRKVGECDGLIVEKIRD